MSHVALLDWGLALHYKTMVQIYQHAQYISIKVDISQTFKHLSSVAQGKSIQQAAKSR